MFLLSKLITISNNTHKQIIKELRNLENIHFFIFWSSQSIQIINHKRDEHTSFDNINVDFFIETLFSIICLKPQLPNEI